MKDKQKIENIIKSGEVVVFMKGTPDFPQCGFSANVIGILNYFNIKFTSFNDEKKIDNQKIIQNKPVTNNKYKNKLNDVKNKEIKNSLIKLTKVFKEK